MSDRKYYVMCEQNCRFESMTKEQILAAIEQAVSTGTIRDVDTGFVQTIKTITGQPLRFFVGTQAEYETLTEEQKQNLFAIITNDTAIESINAAIVALQKNIDDIVDGTQTVMDSVNARQAERAVKADQATTAGYSEYAEKLSCTYPISEGNLPSAGFYYIRAYHSELGNFDGGVVFFDGKTTTHVALGAVHYYLSISPSGTMSVRAWDVTTGKWNQSTTDEVKVYWTKIS